MSLIWHFPTATRILQIPPEFTKSSTRLPGFPRLGVPELAVPALHPTDGRDRGPLSASLRGRVVLLRCIAGPWTGWTADESAAALATGGPASGQQTDARWKGTPCLSMFGGTFGGSMLVIKLNPIGRKHSYVWIYSYQFTAEVPCSSMIFISVDDFQ